MENKELNVEQSEWLLSILSQLTFNVTGEQLEKTLEMYKGVKTVLLDKIKSK